MQLIDLRTEVLNHGFDPIQYGTRINSYINDAQNMIARRVDYYGDETTFTFNTTTGINTYPWPANLARIRSLFDTSRNVEMLYASLRSMDISSPGNAAPLYYAISTSENFQLYPTPDGVYPLELRYWQTPPQLIQDTDVPTLPFDYHNMLWVYAVAQCYWADDDQAMGTAWDQKFATALSEFSADQKFPDTDGPSQVMGMWDQEEALNGSSTWTYGTGYGV